MLDEVAAACFLNRLLSRVDFCAPVGALDKNPTANAHYLLCACGAYGSQNFF